MTKERALDPVLLQQQMTLARQRQLVAGAETAVMMRRNRWAIGRRLAFKLAPHRQPLQRLLGPLASGMASFAGLAGRLLDRQQATGQVHYALEAGSLSQGGLERVIIDLAAGLRASGVETRLVVQGASADVRREAAEHGVTLERFNAVQPEQMYRKLVTERGLRLANGHYSRSGARCLARMGIPFVETLHNTYVWYTSGHIADLLHNEPYTQRYVAVSKQVARYAEARLGLPAHKIVCIANGLNIPRLRAWLDHTPERECRAAVRAHYGFRDEDVVFLNAASLLPAKNQIHIVRALAGARPQIKVLLAGMPLDARYATAVQREVEENHLTGRVILCGYHRDVLPLYLAADAFVLPSAWEGWSIALGEALWFGLPCVATDVGAAAELIDETGMGIVIPGVAPSVAEIDASMYERRAREPQPLFVDRLTGALNDVCEHVSRWQGRAAAARAWMETHYSLARTVAAYKELYESLT